MKARVLTALVMSSLVATAAWGGEKAASTAGANKASAGTASPDNSTDELRRQKLIADKRLVVAENLSLTDKEGKGFWPLYDSYQSDLAKLNLRISGVVTAYIDAYSKGPIPDDVAQKLLKDSSEIDRDEVELKQAHFARVEKVIRPSKLIRYAQIENKIRSIIKYELAVKVPIAE
jgi:hypothetical protein